VTTVLIAPDKFKGSLTAAEVAESLSNGLVRAGMKVLTLPLADGGDGSVAAALASGFSAHDVQVQGATGRPHSATIAVDGDTAIVEIANACGLGTLPEGRLEPMKSSSFGLGQAIRYALDLGVGRIVLGLGGSASSDAGIGMLSALGFEFYRQDGRQVAATTENLSTIYRVTSGSAADSLAAVQFIVAGDVTNPLIGHGGAAAVYGPQKGASLADIDALELG
jgi:glycerate kinase